MLQVYRKYKTCTISRNSGYLGIYYKN